MFPKDFRHPLLPSSGVNLRSLQRSHCHAHVIFTFNRIDSRSGSLISCGYYLNPPGLKSVVPIQIDFLYSGTIKSNSINLFNQLPRQFVNPKFQQRYLGIVLNYVQLKFMVLYRKCRNALDLEVQPFLSNIRTCVKPRGSGIQK